MATAKKSTKTRASQYEAITDNLDVKIKDCQVLSFKFPSEGESHTFHFSMMENNLHPLVYDGPTDIARIVIRKSDLDLFNQLMNLASSMNGVYKECKAYNDYV